MVKRKQENYRRIWEVHHGKIPKDEFGRTYEIHHKDGNRNNNEIENLVALSVQEHYDVHLSQGDYSAALFIAQYRLNKTRKELSELAKKSQTERSKNGKHHFLGGTVQRDLIKRRKEEGTFHLSNDNPNNIRCSCVHCKKETSVVSLGRHKKCRGEPPMKIAFNCKSSNYIRVSCLYCRKETNIPGLIRHHRKCATKKVIQNS